MVNFALDQAFLFLESAVNVLIFARLELYMKIRKISIWISDSLNLGGFQKVKIEYDDLWFMCKYM